MNKKILVLILFVGIVTLSQSTRSQAVDDKKPAEKKKEVTLKGAKTEPATSIDFVKAFDLQFDSLTTLGARIEEARKNSDPVALANAAEYLAAAEAASGKKASLTAEMLRKEAIELAKLRNSSAELKALASICKGSGADKELLALAEKAEKREAEDLAKFKEGAKQRGIIGYVTAVNNTQYKIYVSENGRQLGWVGPYRTYTFTSPIGHGDSYNSVLTARSQDGSVTWGPYIINETYQDFTWTLNP